MHLWHLRLSEYVYCRQGEQLCIPLDACKQSALIKFVVSKDKMGHSCTFDCL